MKQEKTHPKSASSLILGACVATVLAAAYFSAVESSQAAVRQKIVEEKSSLALQQGARPMQQSSCTPTPTPPTE